MERFADKVVLITGAGDVAHAVGLRVLSEGAKVAFADISSRPWPTPPGPWPAPAMTGSGS